jgi:hypothetical protein
MPTGGTMRLLAAPANALAFDTDELPPRPPLLVDELALATPPALGGPPEDLPPVAWAVDALDEPPVAFLVLLLVLPFDVVELGAVVPPADLLELAAVAVERPPCVVEVT